LKLIGLESVDVNLVDVET
jgi:hypothetical protein